MLLLPVDSRLMIRCCVAVQMQKKRAMAADELERRRKEKEFAAARTKQRIQRAQRRQLLDGMLKDQAITIEELRWAGDQLGFYNSNPDKDDKQAIQAWLVKSDAAFEDIATALRNATQQDRSGWRGRAHTTGSTGLKAVKASIRKLRKHELHALARSWCPEDQMQHIRGYNVPTIKALLVERVEGRSLDEAAASISAAKIQVATQAPVPSQFPPAPALQSPNCT